MIIDKLIHWKVKEDGTFKNQLGAVKTKGSITMSTGEGCNLKHCKCSEGHWITVAMPRTKRGDVEVIRVKFKNGWEQNRFFKTHEMEVED